MKRIIIRLTLLSFLVSLMGFSLPLPNAHAGSVKPFTINCAYPEVFTTGYFTGVTTSPPGSRLYLPYQMRIRNYCGLKITANWTVNSQGTCPGGYQLPIQIAKGSVIVESGAVSQFVLTATLFFACYIYYNGTIVGVNPPLSNVVITTVSAQLPFDYNVTTDLKNYP